MAFERPGVAEIFDTQFLYILNFAGAGEDTNGYVLSRT